METIQNYLDHLFLSLPDNADMQKLKRDLLEDLLEKYRELMEEGKTENEAIGIVISEFGNIDEIIEAYEIPVQQTNSEEELYTVEQYELSEDEIQEYLMTKRKKSAFIGAGVFLCVLSPALFLASGDILRSRLFSLSISGDTVEALALVPMFIMIALAVGLFIWSGLKVGNEEDRISKNENSCLPVWLKEKVAEEYQDFHQLFVRAIVVGVGLCILSPVAYLMFEAFLGWYSNIPSAILLAMVAIAVLLFVVFGMINGSYRAVLQIEENKLNGKKPIKQEKAKNLYQEQQAENGKKQSGEGQEKQREKVVEAVESVLWTVCITGYLISGFAFQLWGRTWILFPITAAVTWAFEALYEAFIDLKR